MYRFIYHNYSRCEDAGKKRVWSGKAEETFTGPRGTKFDALYANIKSRLENADGSDEVFRIAEDIPAIQRCTDKALSIARADKEDAEVAVVAIHRLASLCVEPNKWVLTAGDRRFDQLSDCVDLQLPHLPILDLCKYLWATSVIRLSDEERSLVVFTEFLRRIESEVEDARKASVWSTCRRCFGHLGASATTWAGRMMIYFPNSAAVYYPSP